MRAGVVAGCTAVVVGQGADAATFAAMTAHAGIAAEANPLVLAIASAGGIEAVLMVKVIVAALAVAAVAACWTHRARATAAIIAVIALGGGLFGAYTNIVSLGG